MQYNFYGAGLYVNVRRAAFGTHWNIYDGALCENHKKLYFK